MNILITGVAGFIGSSLAINFLKSGFNVYGIDNLNDYYDLNLKNDRLKRLMKFKNFSFSKIDITNSESLSSYLGDFLFDKVINLAAQAGVRYSLTNPASYIDSNILGFFNLMEALKERDIEFYYASSSSVYGDNENEVFSELNSTDNPLSLYAATKKTNEILAYYYASMFNLKAIGLRFFTVYGPWGRPDMSLYKFTDAIYNNKKIDVYNFGKHLRDFTFIDDITNAIQGLVTTTNAKFSGKVPHEIYNISSNKPEKLMVYIRLIEKHLSKKAHINFLPLQKGDVLKTSGDIIKLHKLTGFVPQFNIDSGIKEFVNWYKDYHGK